MTPEPIWVDEEGRRERRAAGVLPPARHRVSRPAGLADGGLPRAAADAVGARPQEGHGDRLLRLVPHGPRPVLRGSQRYGDLYVVVGHDANIRLLKGEGHPLLLEDERRYVVGSIKYVKQALISTGEGWLDADPEIQRFKPDIYAVNEDGDKGGKREYCERWASSTSSSSALPRPAFRGAAAPICAASSEDIIPLWKAAKRDSRAASGALQEGRRQAAESVHSGFHMDTADIRERILKGTTPRDLACTRRFQSAGLRFPHDAAGGPVRGGVPGFSGVARRSRGWPGLRRWAATCICEAVRWPAAVLLGDGDALNAHPWTLSAPTQVVWRRLQGERRRCGVGSARAGRVRRARGDAGR